MTQNFFDWFFKDFDFEAHETATFSQWIDNKTEWSNEKRKKYFKTYLGQKYGKISKFVGSFKTMVKSGETYF